MWHRKKTAKAENVYYYCDGCGLWLVFAPSSAARCHYCEPRDRFIRID
jgi:hypothetical protein